jgi:hypothetical protein
VFAGCYVTLAIVRFICFEVGRVAGGLFRIGLIAGVWGRAFVAVRWIVMVIHVALEIVGAVKPRAGADEYAAGEPFRAVVAVGAQA